MVNSNCGVQNFMLSLGCSVPQNAPWCQWQRQNIWMDELGSDPGVASLVFPRLLLDPEKYRPTSGFLMYAETHYMAPTHEGWKERPFLLSTLGEDEAM